VAKDNRGGPRRGAGRPKGSRNKATNAREAIAEILDVDDPHMLAGAIHKRGHTLLTEMERIACDPTQPVGAGIMAARTALPFLLPRRTAKPIDEAAFTEDLVEDMRQRRNQLASLGATPSHRISLRLSLRKMAQQKTSAAIRELLCTLPARREAGQRAWG